MWTGDRFGRWTVTGAPPANAHALVECQCDCGTVRNIKADNLRRGTSRSCGCLRSEVNRAQRRSPTDRFWEKVEKDGPIPEHRPDLGPCWLWTSYRDEKGYGRFWDGERQRKAHAVAYELLVGPVLEGTEPDHLCRTRPCVRPDHLEAVTHRVNSQRAQYHVETCSRGHLLPEPAPNGRRVCRECANERNRRYKQRRRRDTDDAVMGRP